MVIATYDPRWLLKDESHYKLLGRLENEGSFTVPVYTLTVNFTVFHLLATENEI